MKKFAALMTGVAAIATAGAASADTINKGQFNVHQFGGILSGLNGTYNAPVTVPFVGTIDLGLNRANSTNGNANISSWHAYGSSAGNNGSASTSDGATFTLNGNVSTDCAFYSGTGDQTLNFGTIGIYASDNTGPANAFTMTDDADVTITTNLAGCNTANTVSISKGDVRGLVNNAGAGYDTNVFQANLPYSVTATYTAAPRYVAAAGTQQTLVVGTSANANSRQHGAWKSPMSLRVEIPQADLALLAGTYTGEMTVNIQAF